MSTNWILHRHSAAARRQRWASEQRPQPATDAELLDLLEADLLASEPYTREASRLLAIWD